MNAILVRKLLRDVRVALPVVALLLMAFQCLWVKIVQQLSGHLLPMLAWLAGGRNVSMQEVEDFIFQGPGRKWFRVWMSRSSRYIPMMAPLLEASGLPRDTVYLAMIESGFSPEAFSWERAAGPWQFISSTGKHDGLAWQNSDGTWGGPVGETIARVLEEGYSTKSQPFHGYYFKILKGQGPAAPLGEMDFVVKGAMIGGFALAAAPAEYRVTGVKTFIVSYEGVVYQEDLGPDTLKIFKDMELYNPDKTWQRTDDTWPSEDADN